MAEEHESTNAPTSGTSMFGVPVTPRAGELGRPFRVRERNQHSDLRTSEQAAGDDSSSTPEPADLVAGIQQRQAERDRLLGLCQQLRRQHRCPGRCVFTGELRGGGLAAFRLALDGTA